MHGIDAVATGQVTVETARDVIGGDSGIVASSTSGGNVNITTGGANATAEIIGDSGDGINARTIAAGTITIDNGAGVFGSDKGIEALSGTGKITINNTGFVTATSFSAIDAKGGGFAEINNSGIVLGLVNLTAQGDSFNNLEGGVFEARGSSAFGGGSDNFANSGIVHAADDPAVMEQVLLGGLETFNNNNGGVISLVDGQAGDIISMSSDVPGAFSYVGDQGRLAIDADLGPNGFADQLRFNGTADGKTLVHVNVVTVTGPNTAGIPVVIPSDFNATDEEDFDLDGPLNAGFFAWDLRYDPTRHAGMSFTPRHRCGLL